jgi:Tfp pilus assembly protein PilN
MKAVNLLPGGGPNLRAKGLGRGGGASGLPGGVPVPTLAIAGGLLLALVGMVLYLSARNGVAEKEAELARVTQQATAAEAEAAKLKPYGDFQQMAAQRVATVSSLAKSRFDWEQVLRDLSRAVPADVTLDTLTGTVAAGTALAGVGGGGAGAGSLRSTLPVPAVEVSGCTVNQDAVARLMSRLRNVQGATRVSLARSDKDRSGSGSGLKGVKGSGGPCGLGNRPSFDLVVFFENDTAAAPQTAGSPAATLPAAAGATGPSGPTGATGTAPTTQPVKNP